MDWFEMPKKGKLETFTTAYYAPFGSRQTLLHHGCCGLWRWPETLCPDIKEIKPEEVKVGMDVTIKTLKYDDGQISFEVSEPNPLTIPLLQGERVWVRGI